MLNSRQPMLAVLDAYPPPDVRQFRRFPELRLKQCLHPRRSLGQNLIRVPVGFHHDIDNGGDVLVAHALMEQVAHRIHEDHSLARPAKWFSELVGNQSQIKSPLIGMPRHTPESFGERLGVAMSASRTDLGTPTNGVPSCVSPFDLRAVAHWSNSGCNCSTALAHPASWGTSRFVSQDLEILLLSILSPLNSL